MTDTFQTTAVWSTLFTENNSILAKRRRIFRLMPSNPRCRVCNAPFEGPMGFVAHSFWRTERSNLNPNLCNGCETLARKNPGGVEATLALMFADVRGSTALAEKMTNQAFTELMNRFYTVATDEIVRTDGMIEKFIGDEVAALYFPAFAGADYVRRSVDAARQLLRATGHENPNGPWLPIGAGVHTGTAFVGALGQGGVSQITAIGDSANLAARLASSAAPGEILVSETAYRSIAPEPTPPEHRELTLKGKSEPFGVYVLKVGPSIPRSLS